MSLLSSMPHTLTRQRETATVGATFGVDYSYGSDATLSGWVQTASAGESQAFMSRGMEVSHIVYFGTDPSLQPGDQLLYGSIVLVFQGWKDETGLGRLWVGMFQELTNRDDE
jgi:hypothetical protein